MDSVWIGPVRYTVKRVKRLQGEDRRALLGEIDYTHTTISLDEDQSPDSERMSLWHEIVHGILSQYGFRDHDETMVSALANGIADVLQCNPQLRKGMDNV